MATGPVKSQPLHNFSLPFLKWGGKNQTNSNHRIRRPIAGESSTADDQSEPEFDHDGRSHVRIGSRNSRNCFAFTTCSLAEKSVKHSSDEVDEIKEMKGEGEEGDGEEIPQKPWNLRPRNRMSSKAPVDLKNGGELQGSEGAVQQGENPPPKSLRLRGFTESHNVEKKEKRKFWISLSREEIEEDVFIMTGSRPARRPKKRPKNVQKQLDVCFPGLWLVGATADSYRVADTPAKASPTSLGGRVTSV